MAIAFGKRKRKQQDPIPENLSDASNLSSSDDEDVRARFRQAFEARFKPLSPEKKQEQAAEIEALKELHDANGEDEEYSDWNGFSSEDEDFTNGAAVEVIAHTSSALPSVGDRTSKLEAKAFMSSKIPAAPKALPLSQDDADSSDNEASNIQNDASLQRLLRESHLLHRSSALTTPTHHTLYQSSTSSLHTRPSNPYNTGTKGSGALTAIGAARHAAHDLHFRSLGAKPSLALTHQKKMPIAHRKGIDAKKVERGEKRRQEAKEMGVVLEKGTVAGKKVRGKRERGVGGPSVGSFRGGTLTLSKRDVSSIKRGGGKGKGQRSMEVR